MLHLYRNLVYIGLIFMFLLFILTLDSIYHHRAFLYFKVSKSGVTAWIGCIVQAIIRSLHCTKETSLSSCLEYVIEAQQVVEKHFTIFNI